ncbi:MAG: PRC-barrel domain-containing protein [Gemmatimonadaceae bacterium]
MDNEMGDREMDSVMMPLGELNDFEVADDFPDPRGWDVFASDGRQVGKVNELIVDSAAMQTRYLDIRLGGEIADGDERRVLVPVGAAQLDDAKDNVMLGSLTADQLTRLPAYNGEEITRDYENSIAQQVGTGATTGASATPPKDFYSAPQFDEGRFYAPRRDAASAARKSSARDADEKITPAEEELSASKERVRAGEVSIKRRIETEHVSKPVTKMHEKVNVERRPLEAGAAGEERIDVDDQTRRTASNSRERA